MSFPLLGYWLFPAAAHCLPFRRSLRRRRRRLLRLPRTASGEGRALRVVYFGAWDRSTWCCRFSCGALKTTHRNDGVNKDEKSSSTPVSVYLDDFVRLLIEATLTNGRSLLRILRCTVVIRIVRDLNGHSAECTENNTSVHWPVHSSLSSKSKKRAYQREVSFLLAVFIVLFLVTAS